MSWDYVYQYITYSWYTDGWGGNFVSRFVQQAWDKHYIPVISVYLMLGLPTECGESAACYATKLQDSTAVSTYLAALQEAAQQANGDKPVIFIWSRTFTALCSSTITAGASPSRTARPTIRSL